MSYHATRDVQYGTTHGKKKRMSDSEEETRVTESKKPKRKRPVEATEIVDLSAKWNMNRYTNKQRTLVFCSRGVSHRDRHLLQDLRDMLPHSKKEVKFDAKGKLSLINEVCELKSCNNCIFLEAKKRQDLYMWVSKTPHGPSARFLLQNVHTMAEVSYLLFIFALILFFR